MSDYNNTPSPMVYIHTAHDTNQVAWPSDTTKKAFSRAIRVDAACSLNVRFKGKRNSPSDTAHSEDTRVIKFAAGETRSVAVDLIKSTGSTLNSAVIEVYL